MPKRLCINGLTSAKFGVFTPGFRCLALGRNLPSSPALSPGGLVGFLLVWGVKGRRSFAENVWQLLAPSTNTPGSPSATHIHAHAHTHCFHFWDSHLPANRWGTMLFMHEGWFVFLYRLKKCRKASEFNPEFLKDFLKWANEEKRDTHKAEHNSGLSAGGHYCVRDCVCVPNAN